MLVDKKDLVKTLQKHTKKFALNKKWSEELSSSLRLKHGVFKGDTLDIIRGQEDAANYSIMFLYFLCEGMFEISKNKELNPETYFSVSEIEEYSKAYISNDREITFPIKISPVIQIANDQWMTVTDVNFLLKLKRNQMINYNTNTQRNMTKTIKGDQVVYKINLNKKSVKEISKSMEEEKFIPNTLTLNMPQENSEFYYIPESLTLVIESLEHFDIIDGYHRYMGLCKSKENDTDFNYPMELRIVNFSETKCKNFIFQEDQRNQMKKLDSKAFDMNDMGNTIAHKINEEPMSVFNNQINRNGGLINFAEFSECVRYYFCKDIPPAQRNLYIFEITRYLEKSLEQLVEYDTKYLDGNYKYDFKTLNIIMYIFATYKEKGLTHKAFKEIDILLSNANDLDKKVFSRTTISKTNVNRIEALRKKVCRNV